MFSISLPDIGALKGPFIAIGVLSFRRTSQAFFIFDVHYNTYEGCSRLNVPKLICVLVFYGYILLDSKYETRVILEIYLFIQDAIFIKTSATTNKNEKWVVKCWVFMIIESGYFVLSNENVKINSTT